jgi:hypothetical protein
MRETQSKNVCTVYNPKKRQLSPKEKNQRKKEEKRRDEKECYDR